MKKQVKLSGRILSKWWKCWLVRYVDVRKWRREWLVFRRVSDKGGRNK